MKSNHFMNLKKQKMNTIIKPLLFLFLILSQLSASAQNKNDKIQQVEENLTGIIAIKGATPWTLKERMAFYHIPGLSIAVIQNYKIAWAKGYGIADDSLKAPVTASTLFQAGSISKTLNAIAALKLAQDHRLDLNADINNYLIHWKFPYDSIANGKKITMMNLLSHTAGINLHGFPGYKTGMPIPALQQILSGAGPANTPAVRSQKEPGKMFRYSGGGIMVSQMLIMDITGRSYTDYLTNTILRPLGMNNSAYELPGTLTFAAGHNNDGLQIPGKYYRYPELAAAGLWTTPTDLAK
ncbi:MAG: class A beta-lactamase-related serine hydrolase, partial [Sphingobacteriales bacterium]